MNCLAEGATSALQDVKLTGSKKAILRACSATLWSWIDQQSLASGETSLEYLAVREDKRYVQKHQALARFELHLLFAHDALLIDISAFQEHGHQ